ncbi:uncharacterized protein LOC141905196 isoform X2 [Tubulanus polymorphus]|uniref:uncharacterized protein LOC141905196 isoform X2 n=1 Tax=Tubulanus polymorphus TaxID=672921 RepID=UPI003DA4CC7E
MDVPRKDSVFNNDSTNEGFALLKPAYTQLASIVPIGVQTIQQPVFNVPNHNQFLSQMRTRDLSPIPPLPVPKVDRQFLGPEASREVSSLPVVLSKEQSASSEDSKEKLRVKNNKRLHQRRLSELVDAVKAAAAARGRDNRADALISSGPESEVNSRISTHTRFRRKESRDNEADGDPGSDSRLKNRNDKGDGAVRLPKLGAWRRRLLAAATHHIEDKERHIVHIPPLVRFRRAAKLIHIILVAISSTRRENKRQEAKLMSFSQLQDEINQRTVYGDDLEFDPAHFKACKELQISHEAKTIMSMDPKERTEDQLHTALVSLNQAVEAFGEFPIKMQQSLVRRGWYEHFEAKRVIIRQGHYADNFYFILSGTAVVTILTTNPKTGESFQNTVAFLKKGNSFGELALMYGGTRNATVTCKDDVELLAVGRDDFVDIFMHVDKDVEPEHIQFLRTVDLLEGWPTDQLPYEDPKTCLFTYFRRGVIMCRDSNAAEWIYVIKTGSCRVLKALEPARANVPMIATSPDLRANKGSAQVSPRRKQMKNAAVITVPKRGIITQPNRNQLPVINRQNEAKNVTKDDHKQIINKLFEEKHKDENTKPGEKKVNFADAKLKPSAPKPKPNQKVYIQVQKLGPKDTFGMVPIAFSMMHDTMSMILVSDGAECVLISKKFFMQHLNEGHHKRLRQSIQPYPTQESLQQKLQDQLNWEAYKLATVQKELIYNTKLQESAFY